MCHALQNWSWLEMLHRSLHTFSYGLYESVCSQNFWQQNRIDKLTIRQYCQRLQSGVMSASKLLSQVICARCTLIPTATEWFLYVGWFGWIIGLNWLQGEKERGRSAGGATVTFNTRERPAHCAVNILACLNINFMLSRHYSDTSQAGNIFSSMSVGANFKW